MGIGTKQKIWKRVKSAIQATLMMSVYAMPLMMPVKAQAVGLSNTQFATPTQLKQLSLDGHIVFGYRANEATYMVKNNNEQTAPVGDMEWLIGGQDGDDIVLWGEYPILGKMKFNNASGSSENPGNRYAPSSIRTALVGLQTNSDYFGSTEQGLMATTEIKTLKAGDDVEDKLYLAGGTSYDTNIYIGSSDQVSIPVSEWKAFSWLRSPNSTSYNRALVTYPSSSYVGSGNVTDDFPASVCAFKLNLGSVLFASSANSTASSAGTLSQITGEPAMRLRTTGLTTSAPSVTGSTVSFNAPSTERLMVQLNAGGNDYQYYVEGTGESQEIDLATIAASSGIDTTNTLIDGKVWVEGNDAEGSSNRVLKSTAAQTVRFGATGLIDQSMHGVYARVAQNSTDTYNITVSWGDMTFVYDKGYWNGSSRVRATDVPCVEAGATEGATGKWYGFNGTNNKVTITNNSNVDVTASATVNKTDDATVSPKVTGVTLSIAGSTNNEWSPVDSAQVTTLTASPETSPLNPVSKSLLLNVTGTPDNSLENTYANAEVLGTITINFTKSSS